MADPLSIVADQLRRRLTGALALQVREAVGAIPEDRLWWRPNPQSNSVGVLILHLAGAIRHFLCRQIGGFAYTRNRESEFEPNRSWTKQRVLEEFDAAIRGAEATFAALTADKLAAPSPDPRFQIVAEDIIGVVLHASTHVGQIVYLAKLMDSQLEPELWRRSHEAAARSPGRCLVLIRLFQQATIRLGSALGSQLRQVLRTAYFVVRRRRVASSQTEQGLERGHGLLAAIVAKNKFVKVNLELIPAHAVIGPDQPLLQVANSAVR